MKLYRYKKNTYYDVNAFLQDCVNGSLFKKFKDVGELNFDISNEVLLRYDISFDEKDKIINLLVDNIENKYYLACFSKNDPFSNNLMWNKYSNNGKGFCLVYDYKKIRKAIIEQKLGRMNIDEVYYELNPFYINEIIKILCEKTDIRDALQRGDLDYAIKKSYSLIGGSIIKMFLNKKIDYKDENEVRIVLQKIPVNIGDNDMYHNRMIKVIPDEVIISNDLCPFYQSLLISHANKMGIKVKMIDNPCI